MNVMKNYLKDFKKNNKYRLIFEGIICLFFLVMLIISLLEQYTNFYLSFAYYPFSIVMFVFDTILVFWLEFDYFKTYKEIKNFTFSMDLLIAVAIHLTYFFSIIISIIKIIDNHSLNTLKMEFWEVPYSLSFFIGIGHLIEQNLKQKSSLGIKDLLKLQNKSALKKVESGEFIPIKSSEIKVGDIIKVIKGQSVPTDGKLLNDTAYFDYSSLLGESIPKEIKVNEIILSGALVLEQSITYEVTKSMEDSSLAKIIKQLEKILNTKSKMETISNKIVKYFLPITLIVAVLTFVVWMILSFNNIQLNLNLPWYQDFFNNNSSLYYVELSIFNAISVLVIACPCAFGIATPAAIYSSSFLASKNKLLFANAQAYEKLNKIKFLAFDKTGTISVGKPKVINFVGNQQNYDVIHTLASHSTHPLSKAITNYLINHKNNFMSLKGKINEIPGIGIKMQQKNNTYFLGSINQANNERYQWKVKIKKEDALNSIVVFAKNKEVIAYFAIADIIKKDAKEIIAKFKKMGIKTIILSGDKHDVVAQCAKKLDIDYYFGELLPIDKVNKIEEFKKQDKIVFVGDGINDILAIEAANLGMAYASGSEITNSIADISLLETDLNLVYKAFILAKRTILSIKINFLWAFIFNGICVPLAILGIIPIWLGVVLMVTSTIFLLSNTLIFKSLNEKKLTNV